MDGDFIVYCPYCLADKKYKKIVKRAETYFCEDVLCIFFEGEESYKEIVQDQKNNRSNNTIPQSQLCPMCSLLGMEKQLLPIGDAHFCENLECNFHSNELSENINKINYTINITDCSKLFNEPDNAMITNDDINVGSHTISDNNLIAPSINSILHNIKGKMLNWCKLPCGVPGHIRIFCALMIHLEMFDDSEPITDAKIEYKLCEAFSNNFRLEKAKVLSYNFISKLYDLVDPEINKGTIKKNMDERLFIIMENYMSKSSSQGKYIINYSERTSCPTCSSTNETVEISDFFISMERNKYSLRISDNEITYKLFCSHCKGRSNKSISLQNIRDFLILRFDHGITKEDLKNFDGQFSSSNKQPLHLIAVIECSDEYPYGECPHVPITLKSYEQFLAQRNIKQRYLVHLRDDANWYTLGHERPMLVSPQPLLKLVNPRNVRLMILGAVPHSSNHNSYLSPEGYLQRLSNVSRDPTYLSSSDLLGPEKADRVPDDRSTRKRRLAIDIGCEENGDDDIGTTVTSSGVSSASSTAQRKYASTHSRSTVSQCTGSTCTNGSSRLASLTGDRRYDLDLLLSHHREKAASSQSKR